jgi:hypothetical protein
MLKSNQLARWVKKTTAATTTTTTTAKFITRKRSSLLTKKTTTTDTSYYHEHHNYRGISISGISRRRRFFPSSSSENENQKSIVLPVGIFIDLDNVRPDTLRRRDIQDFLAPLKDFGRRITTNMNTNKALDNNDNDNDNNNDDDNNDKSRNNGNLNISAFGNDATFTYISSEERQLDLDQEFIPWGGNENHNSNEDDDDNDNDNVFIAQSGYDNGRLRCGICGAKMKLTKKDKNKGWDEKRKLKFHMKNLHDNEQSKRNIKRGGGRKKNKKLTEKEMIKSKKYLAAQVGLRRNNGDGCSSGGGKKRNDLFRVLKEQGVQVYSAKNVDTELEIHAKKWMNSINNNNTKTSTEEEEEDGDDDDDNDNKEINSNNNNNNNNNWRGCLVVYSKDKDFIPLLKYAQKRNFLTVTVSDQPKQTLALVNSSDFVMMPALIRGERGGEEQGLSFLSSSDKESGSCNDDDNEDEDEDETTTTSDVVTPYMMIRAMSIEGEQFLKIQNEELPSSLKLGDNSSFI